MVNLKERAAAWMAKRPTVQTFYATSDGFFFSDKNQGEAQKHARNRKEVLQVFSRAEMEAEAALAEAETNAAEKSAAEKAEADRVAAKKAAAEKAEGPLGPEGGTEALQVEVPVAPAPEAPQAEAPIAPVTEAPKEEVKPKKGGKKESKTEAPKS